MFRYFRGVIRKFFVDPPELLEDIVEADMIDMRTVYPAKDFYPDARADDLKEACTGQDTDEAKIIDILVHHSNEQRQGIKDAFQKHFGESLESYLKKELGSDFEDVVVALLTPTRLYSARCLREAMQYLGTREWPLIEIMCTRTNKELANIKEVYNTEYGRDLEKDLKSETSGHFKRLLVSQLSGNRDESSVVDRPQAAADAQAIFDAGEAQWGTDEAKISAILSERNYDQLKATFRAYEKLAGRDIEETIRRECSGDLQDAYLTIDPAMPEYKLTYFNLKGRGEVARILFAIADQEYEDNRVEWEQYPELKPSTIFGQLPLLEVDGNVICQTKAICRYLAREFDLAGKTDWDRAWVDMVVDTIDDLLKPTPAIFFAKEEEKGPLIQTYREGVFPNILTRLEKMLEDNDSGYFNGDEMTWADLWFYHYTDNFGMMALEIDPVKFPKCIALREKVSADPKIAAWIEKRPLTMF